MAISTVIRRFTGFSVSSIQLTGANQLTIQNNFLTVIDSVETKCCERKGRIAESFYCLNLRVKEGHALESIAIIDLGYKCEFFNRVKTSVLASFFFL
jgi:hypothetical protein